MFGIVYVFQRSEFSWFSWESRVCEWHVCPKDSCSSQVGIDIGRGMGGFYVRFLDSSTKCRRIGLADLLLVRAVLFQIKRFLGTKHFAEFIWFYLKRFRGTKLPEDCPLWPAAYKVERITQRGVPVRTVRPAGVHGILPFHIICSMSMFPESRPNS